MASKTPPSAFDRSALVGLRATAQAEAEDPKQDPAFAHFAEGVAAVLGWFLGDAPHPALQDALDLE